MSRGFVGIGLVGAAGALGLVLLLNRSCGPSDAPGVRADSVLATEPAWQDTVRQQDATIQAMDSALAAQERQTEQWRRAAQATEREGQRALAEARVSDSTGPLVPGLSQSDSIARLLVSRNLWRTAANHWAYQVVPALRGQITSDSIWKLTALAKADTLTAQRDFARRRANEVTREFQRYRDATRHRGSLNLGFVRVPKAVVEVGKLGLTFYAGCKAAKGC